MSGKTRASACLTNEVQVSVKQDNFTSVSDVYELLGITILRGKLSHGQDVTLCVAIHSPKSRHYCVTFSVSTIMRQRFIFRNVDRIVAGNIETISLEMRI
jgi:hypothetical protein